MTTHQITNKYRATVGDGDGIEYRTQIINDKIEQFIDAMKKMRTLEGQEVEAILSNGTLLSDWLRTTLTTYGAEREAKGREEEHKRVCRLISEWGEKKHAYKISGSLITHLTIPCEDNNKEV